MPSLNIVWPKAYCFCPVRFNTISRRVFGTLSLNIVSDALWVRDECITICGLTYFLLTKSITGNNRSMAAMLFCVIDQSDQF